MSAVDALRKEIAALRAEVAALRETIAKGITTPFVSTQAVQVTDEVGAVRMQLLAAGGAAEWR